MARRYDVRLVLRQVDAPKARELIARFGLSGVPFRPVCVGLVELVVPDVTCGELPDLERGLIESGVAFDRYTASDPPVVRCFRPEWGGRREVDVEVEYVGDGEPRVLASDLEAALASCGDYESLRREIARLVAEAGPRPLENEYGEIRFRRTFWTPYEEFAPRIGEPFEVVGEVADGEKDPEVGRMWRIRFPSDGFELDAWPEEVEEEASARAMASFAGVGGAGAPVRKRCPGGRQR